MRKNCKIPTLCQCRLFINTKASKNSIMFRDVSFFLRWYNVIHWSSHIYKKSSFLSCYSFLVKFSEWHRGSDIVKMKKCDKVEWGEKCYYASDVIFNGPKFNLLFYCHIILNWEKVLWSPNFLENFSASVLMMKVSKYRKIVEFRKISVKMEHCKIIYETQAASRFSAFATHHQIKSYHVIETKSPLEKYTEIYRHLLWKCSKKVVFGCQEMGQWKCIFWHQRETYSLENLQFVFVFGSMLFSISKELRFVTWVKFFE